MTAVLIGGGSASRCRYAVTWTGGRIHRRYGSHIWCDTTRQHAGPPWPEILTCWPRCERCFP